MKSAHINPHYVKKSKELNDNDPNKNDCKNSKAIAGLVNEEYFSYPHIPNDIYVVNRRLSNMRFQVQEELFRAKERIWREVKRRSAGMKRAKPLVSAAVYSVGKRMCRRQQKLS
ncbi:MAG: hypothetical protein ACOX8H_13705 [Ruminococcus sp.]|jgi:hypothetical protein